MDLLEKSSNTINVFSHRDLWKNNLMFKFDEVDGKIDYSSPKHCILLDYQIARYLPLTVDVLMAIVINTRKTHRQQNLEDYLTFYYERLGYELKEEGIEVSRKITFEEFKISCVEFMVLPLTINAVILTLTLMPSEYVKELNLNSDNFYKICNVFRDDVVMDLIERDDDYKECLLEAIEELIEYIYGK